MLVDITADCFWMRRHQDFDVEVWICANDPLELVFRPFPTVSLSRTPAATKLAVRFFGMKSIPAVCALECVHRQGFLLPSMGEMASGLMTSGGAHGALQHPALCAGRA